MPLLPFTGTGTSPIDVSRLDNNFNFLNTDKPTVVTGTWTPVCAYATVGTSSWAPSVQVGTYVKIGRLVTASFRYTGVPTNGTGAGAIQITGLAAAGIIAGSDTNMIYEGPLLFGGLSLTGSRVGVTCSLQAFSSTILLSAYASTLSPANVTVADIPSGGTVILRGTLTFRTDT